MRKSRLRTGGPGMALKLKERSFDGAFVCRQNWVPNVDQAGLWRRRDQMYFIRGIHMRLEIDTAPVPPRPRSPRRVLWRKNEEEIFQLCAKTGVS